MNPAKATRERKENRPELYCPSCLWMTGGPPCHRHGGPEWTPERAGAAQARSNGLPLTPAQTELLGVSQ